MTAKSAEKQRTGYYAGSFNPFTVGHLSVVERAAGLFDRVVIGVGYNAAKGVTPSSERLDAIRKAVSHLPGVTVETYGTLTVEAAKAAGAGWLVRGVRSVADFEYERNLADLNRRISGLETVLLPALPELGCVSSSAVRELQAYGVDVSDMLP